MYYYFNAKGEILNFNIIETFTRPQNADGNGDRYVVTDNYIAVIDGASPKGKMLWENKRGDVYIADLLEKTIRDLNGNLPGTEVLEELNKAIRETYKSKGLSFEELGPENSLEASIALYNRKEQTLYVYGDIHVKINDRDIYADKKLDTLTTLLRSYVNHQQKEKGPLSGDPGREAILPILRDQAQFANADGLFGYPVLNGDTLNLNLLQAYKLKAGDRVVLQTDGYPVLEDTLEEAERTLREYTRKDPDCISLILNTKGLAKGRESYDDRTYVSFEIK